MAQKAGRRIVIGDTHGCSKTLAELLERLAIVPVDNIYLLGDYIDRGPDSKGVLDIMLDLADSGYNVYPLLGNHERMMLDVYEFDIYFNQWMHNGGLATLKSFSCKSLAGVPGKYIDYIQAMPLFYKLPDFVLTHAGLNCRISDPFQDTDAMLWTRDHYVDLGLTGNRRVISGHTPSSVEVIRDSLLANKIRLDGGCVYYNIYPNSGWLCALDLDTMELTMQINIENK